MTGVKHQSLSDETYEGLIGRIEVICDALLRRGDKIIAIMPSPMPLRETEWKAVIFYQWSHT